MEILTWDEDISVRISGVAAFDVPDGVQAEIYAGNAILQRLYPSYDSMQYFSVAIQDCDYYDLRPTPPVLEHHGLTAASE